MKKLIGYIGIVLLAAILLPALSIGALVLYDAPAEVRNMAVIIIVGICAGGAGALFLGKGGKK